MFFEIKRIYRIFRIRNQPSQTVRQLVDVFAETSERSRDRFVKMGILFIRIMDSVFLSRKHHRTSQNVLTNALKMRSYIFPHLSIPPSGDRDSHRSLPSIPPV